MHKRDAKFADKADKVMVKAARKVDAFKKAEPLNVYKKSSSPTRSSGASRTPAARTTTPSDLTRWLTVRL